MKKPLSGVNASCPGAATGTASERRWFEPADLHEHRLLVLVAGVTAGLFAVAYVHVAGNAWFFQDDFLYLTRYARSAGLSSPTLAQLLVENFGRPVSRNLYWFVLYQSFGMAAPLYYLANLGIVMACAVMLFRLGRLLGADFSTALVWSVSYFVSAPTVGNLSWLSNSQHMLAHLFTVLALTVGVRDADMGNWAWYKVVVLGALCLLGAFSNAFALAAIPLILLYCWSNGALGRAGHCGPFLVLTIVWLASAAVLFYALKGRAAGPYELDVSARNALATLAYYVEYPKVTLLCLGGVGVVAFVRRDHILLWLLASAVLFYAPFAFLKFQRYENYIGLAHLFVVAALAWLVTRSLPRLPRIRDLLLVLLIGAVALGGREPLRSLVLHPKGKAEKELIEGLAVQVFGGRKLVCLRLNTVNNTTGVSEWDIPPTWWFLGLGEAFLWVPTISPREYVLGTDSRCAVAGAVHVAVGRRNGRYIFAALD